jgi:hypothetical protein
MQAISLENSNSLVYISLNVCFYRPNILEPRFFPNGRKGGALYLSLQISYHFFGLRRTCVDKFCGMNFDAGGHLYGRVCPSPLWKTALRISAKIGLLEKNSAKEAMQNQG